MLKQTEQKIELLLPKVKDLTLKWLELCRRWLSIKSLKSRKIK
jgi:hypothetical protein